LDGDNDRFVEPNQRLDQAALRKIAQPRRVLDEILDVVSCTERLASAMPKDNADFAVIGGLVEDVRFWLHRNVRFRAA